jgi:hypothetical protein
VKQVFARTPRIGVGIPAAACSRRAATYGSVSLSVLFFVVLLSSNPQSLRAQSGSLPPTKLPSAEKIVDSYLKTIGGKKRLTNLRDVTYEWEIRLRDRTLGIAKTQTKSPSSVRTELSFGNGQVVSAATPRSAWTHGLDGKLQTLTDAEAAAARLQAVLDASHLLDIKKSNVLARVVSYKVVEAGAVYVVEFSLRSGARLRYLFSPTTKLLVGREDDARKTTTHFDDYRAEGNILEPHRVSIDSGTGDLTFVLQRVSYNIGITDAAFDPPRAAESLDVTALLREVSRNQDELEKRFTEYSFIQKETDREITDKGEVKKETVKVHEVFPIANREPLMKLISENGIALSDERAAKEQKRVEEEFARMNAIRIRTRSECKRAAPNASVRKLRRRTARMMT